mgnify:CR=1 FL=1|tara:strand:- start:12865 stop:13419 length:555 start_codon:yes stop_codon:yes gene_type:complete
MDIKEHEKIIAKHFDDKHVGELSSDSIFTIKDICKITNPINILEIGFNRGNSALMWLENSNASLTSLDITDKPKSVSYLESTYKDRFTFRNMDSGQILAYKLLMTEPFDLVFIDGDHSYQAVKLDAENSIELNTKYIVFDDYNHWSHGDDIKMIINELPLEIVKEYDTGSGQVLVKNLKWKNNE